MAPDHGPQFDRFTASAGHLHGGSYFDEFSTPEAREGAHGRLMDTFERRQPDTAHGERYDEFAWRAMPERHGDRYDSDFTALHALDGQEGHGTWHDVFTAGTKVRYTYEGKPCEGTVLNAGDDLLFVEPSHGGANGGGRHEVSLPQVEAFTQQAENAPKLKAQPGQTDAPFDRSTAEAPSAHDATAHGGAREDAAPTLKLAISALTDVAKSIDSTDTALQGPAAVGHRKGCPRTGSAPCGPATAGHCARCNAVVRDHQALAKTGQS